MREMIILMAVASLAVLIAGCSPHCQPSGTEITVGLVSIVAALVFVFGGAAMATETRCDESAPSTSGIRRESGTGSQAREERRPQTCLSPKSLFAALCRKVGFRFRRAEFYLVREIPYSRLDDFRKSTLVSLKSKTGSTSGRIKESLIASVLSDYFGEKAERILRGIRPLPETVWFSIECGIGTRGDEALATIRVATPKYLKYLPIPLC